MQVWLHDFRGSTDSQGSHPQSSLASCKYLPLDSSRLASIVYSNIEFIKRLSLSVQSNESTCKLNLLGAVLAASIQLDVPCLNTKHYVWISTFVFNVFR